MPPHGVRGHDDLGGDREEDQKRRRRKGGQGEERNQKPHSFVSKHKHTLA